MQTIPKSGYRLLVEIGRNSSVPSGEQNGSESRLASERQSRWRPSLGAPWIFALGMVFATALWGALFFLSTRSHNGWTWLSALGGGKDEEARVGEAISSNATAKQRRSILILPFDNRTDKSEFGFLGRIIADWLTRRLEQSDQLSLVSGDLALRSTGLLDEETRTQTEPSRLRKVAEAAAVDTVITGAYYLHAGQLTVRGELHEVVEDRISTKHLPPAATSAGDPINVLKDLEQHVVGNIAARFDATIGTLGILVSAPPSYEAYEAYLRGMDHHYNLEFPTAIEWFKIAAQLAPDFNMPRLMAATDYLNTGDFAALAASIDELSDPQRELEPLDRLFLEWLRAEYEGDYRKAAHFAGQAASIAPLSPWIQSHGVDALRANMPYAALKALRPIDTRHGALRGWTPHYEYLTLAFHLTKDYEGELASARLGTELYPDSILCLRAEARALLSTGRRSEALALLEKGYEASPEHIGTMLAYVASEFDAHGHEDEAMEAASRILSWLEQRKEPSLAERQWIGYGRLMLGDAERAFEVFRDLHRDNPDSIEHRGQLGVAAAAAGRISVSDAQAAALDTKTVPYDFGRRTYWRAAIQAWRGDDHRAIELYEEAVREGHPFVWPRLHPHHDPILRPLRDVPAFVDAIRPRG